MKNDKGFFALIIAAVTIGIIDIAYIVAAIVIYVLTHLGGMLFWQAFNIISIVVAVLNGGFIVWLVVVFAKRGVKR